MKFSGQRELAEALGRAMAGAWRDLDGTDQGDDHGTPPEAVTWVPLSARRRAERGFDQAEALARVAATALRLPLVRSLERVVDTPPQARRGAAERRRALAGAFRAVPSPPTRVLLIDDVITTGSTASECARVLCAAGAVRVEVLVAARALPGALPPRCYAADELPFGSVVARGSSSIVDASRRRNDPRKATLGR